MRVEFLVGPTASGKSALGLQLAEEHGGAILNADSIQVYDRLQIGSAAPTAEEKARVPHFFFQEIQPPERITAADYARRAHEILHNLSDRFPVVFVVGGTGFYLQALEKGMLPIDKADPQVQAALEAQLLEPGGPERLHAELTRKDPVAVLKIPVNDHYRLVRAIEIIRRTGRPLSEIKQEHRESQAPFPYPLRKWILNPDRAVLEQRVRLRTKKMLQEGLIDEVQGLIGAGLKEWEPLQSVGYHETLQYLAKSPLIPDLTTLEMKINQSTMQLAKRQRTWFRRDPETHPYSPALFAQK